VSPRGGAPHFRSFVESPSLLAIQKVGPRPRCRRWHEAISDFPVTRSISWLYSFHHTRHRRWDDIWWPMNFLFGLPFAYLFGFPVVLIMWGADWWLSDKISMPVKVVTSACVGYVAIFALLLMAATRHLTLHECLTFGIVGAIPAAFCSWLAGWFNKETAN
jgi:hypothetical protein